MKPLFRISGKNKRKLLCIDSHSGEPADDYGGTGEIFVTVYASSIIAPCFVLY